MGVGDSYQKKKKQKSKKGFMSSEKISADFSMQVSQTGEADLSFYYFPNNQRNIPMSYLLNLQLLQKEREERHGKKICYGF